MVASPDGSQATVYRGLTRRDPLVTHKVRQEAACRYGRWAVCGVTEMYPLAAMNGKLRYFPEFAEAVDIHCVSDCASARAFTRAYAAYLETHPGFDREQPLEADPPP